MNNVISPDPKAKRPLVFWTTADGRCLAPSEMSVAHLANCILWIQDQRKEQGPVKLQASWDLKRNVFGANLVDLSSAQFYAEPLEPQIKDGVSHDDWITIFASELAHRFKPSPRS